jgi:hypothetical protein
MGQWVIVIQGTGSHHNGLISDADKIAEALVGSLKTAGQYVEHASFTSGGRELLHTTTVKENKDG